MATFTNVSKSSAPTYTNINQSGQLAYIQTDAPDLILVGSAEDEFLIWQSTVTYTNLTKS